MAFALPSGKRAVGVARPVGPALASTLADGRMPVWLIILLGVLSAVGPLSTDMYLPAFPSLEAALGSGTGSAQITLAAWFAGLAAGQFSQGPLSDRWGRRAPLLGGMAIFTAGSIGCALSHDIWSFTLCRFLAALGGSSGMVIPRAVVRDVATGTGGAKIMSQLMLVLGVVPIMAPTLGGFVLEFANWRWIFWIATLYGACCFVAVLLALPDTLPAEHRLRLRVSEMLGRYIAVFREPVFLSHTMICSFSTFIVFAYLAGTPVVFERLLQFTPTGFGMMFGVNAFFYILGTQVNARIVGRVGTVRMMRRGILFLSVSGCVLALFAVTGLSGAHRSLLATVLPITGVMASLGFISPNAIVIALGAHARQAGSASALLGTLQFTLGAVSGLLMGWFALPSIVPMAMVILLGVVGINLAGLIRPRTAVRGDARG